MASIDYLKEISPDLAMEILYKLDPFNLKQACTLNKYFQKRVCTINFRNLYRKKNGKSIYRYNFREQKVDNLGVYYDILGYSSKNVYLADLYGKYIEYDLNDNTKLLLALNYNLKKFVHKSYYDIFYFIDDQYSLVSVDSLDSTKKILATKVKDAIIISNDLFILKLDGSVYHTPLKTGGKYFNPKDLRLVKKGVKQIILNLLDVVLLNKNGSFSIAYHDTEENNLDRVSDYYGIKNVTQFKAYDMNDERIEVKKIPKFKFITNSGVRGIFLRDSNGNGWDFNLINETFTDLGIKLKKAYYIGEDNLIGIGFDGKLYRFAALKKEWVLFPGKRNHDVLDLYKDEDNFLVEYRLE